MHLGYVHMDSKHCSMHEYKLRILTCFPACPAYIRTATKRCRRDILWLYFTRITDRQANSGRGGASLLLPMASAAESTDDSTGAWALTVVRNCSRDTETRKDFRLIENMLFFEHTALISLCISLCTALRMFIRNNGLAIECCTNALALLFARLLPMSIRPGVSS